MQKGRTCAADISEEVATYCDIFIYVTGLFIPGFVSQCSADSQWSRPTLSFYSEDFSAAVLATYHLISPLRGIILHFKLI